MTGAQIPPNYHDVPSLDWHFWVISVLFDFSLKNEAITTHCCVQETGLRWTCFHVVYAKFWAYWKRQQKWKVIRWGNVCPLLVKPTLFLSDRNSNCCSPSPLRFNMLELHTLVARSCYQFKAVWPFSSDHYIQPENCCLLAIFSFLLIIICKP